MSFHQSRLVNILNKLSLYVSTGKVLIITQERGILPDDIADHYQLKQFTTLQLNGSISINTQYDFKRMFKFLIFIFQRDLFL
jgi:hypothetical protein